MTSLSNNTSSEWVKRIQSILSKSSLRYEVEEAIRIHVDDIIIQIGESSDGLLSVSFSISLPSESSKEEIERVVQSFEKALHMSSILEQGELSYELDTSLPNYPVLYIVRKYRDTDALILDVEKMLKAIS